MGRFVFPIVGIIVDYTDQQGTVFMDRSVFLKYWQDDAVSDFRVFVAARRRSRRCPTAHRRALRGPTAGLRADQRGGRQLHSENHRSVVRPDDVQIAMAVFVAILGIVNALTVSITDRRRELGV